MADCDNRKLFRSDWSNMALIHVLHQHVILFMLIISFIYISMYLLKGVSPINTFPSTFIAPKKSTWGVGNIRSLCSSHTYIWSIFFYLFIRVPFVLKNDESDTFGYFIKWGCLFIQSNNLLIRFSEDIFHHFSLDINQLFYPWNVWLQHETFFITIGFIIHFTYLTRK